MAAPNRLVFTWWRVLPPLGPLAVGVPITLVIFPLKFPPDCLCISYYGKLPGRFQERVALPAGFCLESTTISTNFRHNEQIRISPIFLINDKDEKVGSISTNDHGFNVTAKATWSADTLVLTVYALGNVAGGIHDYLNIERWTISADGNTMVDASLGIPDGKIPPEGPRVFLLRRIGR